MEKSWVTELHEDCQWQEIIQFFSFKIQAGTSYIIEIMWLGQVHLKFQLCYFGGDGEELGNWTSWGLSMSGDYSVLFIQKSSRNFLHYWDNVVGTGSSEVPVVLFWACFWKKMLNLRSSTACLFSLNPLITEQKNFLLLWKWVHIVPTF